MQHTTKRAKKQWRLYLKRCGFVFPVPRFFSHPCTVLQQRHRAVSVQEYEKKLTLSFYLELLGPNMNTFYRYAKYPVYLQGHWIVPHVDDLQIYHLQIDRLDPNPPLWDVVQDLCGTNPGNMCYVCKSCRISGLHSAT